MLIIDQQNRWKNRNSSVNNASCNFDRNQEPIFLSPPLAGNVGHGALAEFLSSGWAASPECVKIVWCCALLSRRCNLVNVLQVAPAHPWSPPLLITLGSLLSQQSGQLSGPGQHPDNNNTGQLHLLQLLPAPHCQYLSCKRFQYRLVSSDSEMIWPKSKSLVNLCFIIVSSTVDN